MPRPTRPALPTLPGPPPGIIERTPETRQLEALRAMSAALQRRQDRPQPQPLQEIIRAAQVPEVEEANPPEYMEWLREQKAANDARFGAPVTDTQGEALAGAEALTGAEGVAEETQAEADTEAPTPLPGELPTVERSGDLARARAEQKIAKLTAFRDIAEGLGKPIPVAGTFLTGGQAPPPFFAEGIRDALKREEISLQDLSAEDKIRLQSDLRLKGEKELLKMTMGEARAGEEGKQAAAQEKKLLTERTRFLGSKVFTESNKALAAARKVRGLLAAETTSSIEHAAAARSVLQAAGEGARMSDQDIKQVLFNAGFKGTIDRFVRFVSSEMTESVKKIYLRVVDALEAKVRDHLQKEALGQARSYSNTTGMSFKRVLDSYGVEGVGGGDRVDVQIPGEEQGNIARVDLEKFRAAYPDATISD